MREEEPCLVGDLACQLEKGGYKQKSKEQIIREIDGLRPDGWKRSITLAAGFPSNLNANGKKVPTVLYGGLSLVTDNNGGIQLFYETLAIEFDPTLELGQAEKAQPSELLGMGISATMGPIWKTVGDPFVTNDYEGEAHSNGGSWSIVTADYYQSFPDPKIMGLDIGPSFGSPSLWSISTNAHKMTRRFDLTPDPAK